MCLLEGFSSSLNQQVFLIFCPPAAAFPPSAVPHTSSRGSEGGLPPNSLQCHSSPVKCHCVKCKDKQVWYQMSAGAWVNFFCADKCVEHVCKSNTVAHTGSCPVQPEPLTHVQIKVVYSVTHTRFHTLYMQHTGGSDRAPIFKHGIQGYLLFSWKIKKILTQMFIYIISALGAFRKGNSNLPARM